MPSLSCATCGAVTAQEPREGQPRECAYCYSERRACERAAALGREAGLAAGSWAADGNTSEEHARRVLAMLEEGDPAAEAYLPAMPDLSGEWAGAPTPASLWAECWHGPSLPGSSMEHALAAVCEAWEEAASEAHAHECERTLRAQLSCYQCPGCAECAGEEPSE